MTTANVLIIAGQSNALGFRVTPAELPADYHPDAHVQIWTDAGWATMTPGVNTGTPANPDAWGPEVAEAMKWTAAHPGEDLYIVKSVKGSTGLAADPNELDWSPQSRGEMFDATAAKVHAATDALTASGHAVSFVGVDWMQGEQDAISATKAAAYLANELDFFAHVRADWAQPDTAISFGRIASGDALPYEDQVRAAQDQAATMGHEVNTDAFDQQADHLHFTGAGEIDLGGAFYDSRTPPAALDITDLSHHHAGFRWFDFDRWIA